MITGRLPVRIGLYGLDGEDRHVFTATHTTGLPKEEITIAEILRDNGYSTGMVGKWNLGKCILYKERLATWMFGSHSQVKCVVFVQD